MNLITILTTWFVFTYLLKVEESFAHKFIGTQKVVVFDRKNDETFRLRLQLMWHVTKSSVIQLINRISDRKPSMDLQREVLVE